MPEAIRRANNAKSRSARVSSMCSPSRRTGWIYSSHHRIARATIKIGMANLVDNIKRLLFLRRPRSMRISAVKAALFKRR